MDPEEIDALLDRANRLLEAGRAADSLRCLEQLDGSALEEDDRIEWGSLRAWALSDLGRDDEALETLDALLEEYPQAPRLLSTLGVVLSNRDELDEARDALEEALALRPDDEVALANLALVYEKLRDYERALELYDRALSLGADIDWVLQRKAAALTECERYAEAKATLKRYLSLVPDDAAQWVALGILHSDDEEFEPAYACYAQAEKLEPDSGSLRLNWGVTAVRAGDLKVARQQLKHLQRIEPHSSRPWLLRAFILEEGGETTAARVIYDRILARSFRDHDELTYALEMAMDFFARHKLRSRCERLLARAYAENACTVELCEAYREVTGTYAERSTWFSLLVECDYRPGLLEVYEPDYTPETQLTRFVRDVQVVAADRDEAVGLALDFVRRMGESHPRVREFLGEEELKNIYTGVYEIESTALVFGERPLGPPPG